MPPREKRASSGGGAVAGAVKAARGGGIRVLLPGWERAVVPKQPTTSGRSNACWAPPVVAIASFYHVTKLPTVSQSFRTWPAGVGGGEITADSVLRLRPGDDDEEACEVLEDITGWWLPEVTWGNDEEFIKSEGEISWGGPTSVSDYGTHAVAEPWWSALMLALSDNIVLLLVERLEGGKDQGNTHYLLVLGYEEEVRRRGGNVRKLWLKDPMEGDELLEAEFWAEPAVELMTRQSSGKPLDRYTILEATHLKAPTGVVATAEPVAGVSIEARRLPAAAGSFQ